MIASAKDTAKSTLVLITGANQGIGCETAKDLLVDNYCEEAATTLQAILGIENGVSSIQTDVPCDRSQYGRLDVLVNNARIKVLAKSPDREALRKIVNVNVVGALSTTEAFLDTLRLPSERCLVFVSSGMGSITHAADPTSVLYSSQMTENRTSKAAVNMMVMCVARLRDEEFEVVCRNPRNVAEPAGGDQRVSVAVKEEKVADVEKVLGVYGAGPFRC
ncbi:NAD(P)-binding protein [Aspergillus heteromorphus CBS 117.55]|uniref:NAD(P)-binding protein n=1 Tax=Aspergillus heteromorphus CBS 117.55 TaxID=1448321 RepID=A0A317UVW1_9EURO|nr:NAD(P)-binding protein [Aspergillus heteromorphus CBS 117.55]PWY65586.1 NAD(P)-binding protein [Aspergillus heteromorphus CBS 117.55]